VLQSQLLGSSADLAGVADGTRTISSPEQSESVALIQQALLAVEASLPTGGVDEWFGDETGLAVSAYKSARGLVPTDPVVGRGTIASLDREIAYLEGTSTDAVIGDGRVLALDPLFAGVLDTSFPGVDRLVRDVFEFGDRLCFRLSFLLGADIAKLFGRFVEGPIFADYCALLPPCSDADFVDAAPGSTPYVQFLQRRHPTAPPAELQALGARRRPDILSNRPTRSEWYENKPASVAGAIGAWKKLNSIPTDYARLGLPYQPGTAYQPTEEIPLAHLIGPQGEALEVIVHVWRRAPGLIFYELCIKGDYVQYFNHVRLVAGILAILVAIPGLIPAAEEGVAILAALRALAAQLEVVLPAVVPAL
jgi:hypothetical protein